MSGRDPDDDGKFVMPKDVQKKARALTNEGVKIAITPSMLMKRIVAVDAALNADSNDEEHDALYYLREWLSEIYEDPRFRIQGNHRGL